MALLEIRKTSDGRVQARRKDGKPLTRHDREAARQLAEKQAHLEPWEDDPLLSVEVWFPVFGELHHRIVQNTPDFDYIQIREENPDLYKEIKAKESQIDALGEARLSEVMALVREWRELVLKADFKQRVRKSA